MTVDRRFLNWGIFLIVLGLVPLLVRIDAIAPDAVREAWRLWPLIIVGIGVGIILRRSPLAPAGGLIVASTFGLMVGAFLAVGPMFTIGCGAGQGSGPTVLNSESGSFGGASSSIRIALDCGSLQVGTGPNSEWSVQARDPQEAPARIDHGSNRLTVQTSDSGTDFIGALTGDRGQRSWQVTVPTDPQVSLRVDLNAGDGHLVLANTNLSRLDGTFNAADVRIDLSGASVGGLSLDYNAGSGQLTLPANSSFGGSLHVNAASVDICAPGGVGLRFVVTGALNSTNFDGAGLVQSGDTWTSPGFQSASNRVDLDIEANAASVTLNPAGGCR